MNTKFLSIPLHLQSHIHSIWTLNGMGAKDEPNSFGTTADGRPGLIVQLPERGIYFQKDKELPPAFLYGAATCPGTIEVVGEFSTIGIYFHPTALKSVFGLNADALTDTCVDLNLVLGSENRRRVADLDESLTLDKRVAVMADVLLSEIDRNTQRQDANLIPILAEIAATAGSLSVKELGVRHRLSERSLERKFRQSVGLSPRMYLRIVRFQETVKQLRAGHYAKLSDVAYDQGYADQSHFIRAFKEFSGLSPKDYLAYWQGVAIAS